MRIPLLLGSFFMFTACADEETKKVSEDFEPYEGTWAVGTPTLDNGCG